MSSRAGQHLGRSLRLHTPLYRVLGSSLVSFAALASLHLRELASTPPLTFSAALLSGVVYTQFFEYVYHRYLMHQTRGFIRNTHLTHHRIFHGSNYTTRSEKDLQHVAGRWYLFPPCFVLHYLLAGVAIGSELTMPFMTGCTLHYVAFETSHWFAHVEDNLFDRFIGRVPLLRTLRAAQLAHHRLHHDRPTVNFNFNAPYFGDALARTRGAAPTTNRQKRTPPSSPAVPSALLTSGSDIRLGREASSS